MPCQIVSYAYNVAADGTPVAVSNVEIVARPSSIPIFQMISGSMQETPDPTRTATTDTNGRFEFDLPYVTEQDPQTAPTGGPAKWAITDWKGFVWTGIVPSIPGPISLWDLKNTYGWALTSPPDNFVPIAIAGIQGPAGPAGPVFSGPLTTQTSGTTPQSLSIFSPATQGVYNAELRIKAQLADGTIGRSWRQEVVVMRDGAGVVTVVGSNPLYSPSSDPAADPWDVTATAPSGALLIRVTGNTGQIVNWEIKYAIA